MANRLSAFLSRRKFFSSTGAAALGFGVAASANASGNLQGSDFEYEVTRTEEEWRAMLDPLEYAILREGKTEAPQSSPLWVELGPGGYHCKGCDLKVYDGRWKTVLEKGWVFFYHAEPNAVLMDIDGAVPEYGAMASGYEAIPEVHCRQCGSHLGHYLYVEGFQTHCINGVALVSKSDAT